MELTSAFVLFIYEVICLFGSTTGGMYLAGVSKPHETNVATVLWFFALFFMSQACLIFLLKMTGITLPL